MENGQNDDLIRLLDDPPQSIEGLVAAMSPDLYHKLKSGIELGKWEDGQRIDKSQLEQCMQLVILYEAQNLPEHERIGAPLTNSCGSASEKVTTPAVESRSISVILSDTGSASSKS